MGTMNRKYVVWLIVSFVVSMFLCLMIPFAIYEYAIHSSYFLPEGFYPKTIYWQDKLWLVEELFGKTYPDNRIVNLLSISPDSGQIQKIDTSSGEYAFLLPDKDKLWIFVADSYSCRAGDGQHIAAFKYYSNGKIITIPLKEQLENITEPFLYEGAPAVIELKRQKQVFKAFRNNHWETIATFTLKPISELACSEDIITGFSKDNEINFIADLDGSCFARKGIPSPNENIIKDWQKITGLAICSQFKSSDYVPFQLHYQNDKLIGGIRSKTGNKTILFKSLISDPSYTDIYKKSTPGDFLVVIQYDWETLAFRLIDIHNGDIVSEKEIGKKSLFTTGQKKFVSRYGMIFVMTITLIIFPLVISIVFAWLKNKYRTSYYSWQDQQIPYASILQRTVASIIDFIIIGAIIIPVFIMTDWESYFFAPIIMTIVVLFFVFVYVEGRCGFTPGKYIMKIKVVNMEIKPCGIWSSFLRNLLKYAIESNYFAIAFFMIALTSHWQRLGDLLAKTIVIKNNSREISNIR